jgi:large subunit ribosomal protein L15
MIDTGRLNPNQPIDLAALCNTKVVPVDPNLRHFGLNLTDEGADHFEAKVNIEVQYASEQAIAAVERNGGVITTAYFDLNRYIQGVRSTFGHFR